MLRAIGTVLFMVCFVILSLNAALAGSSDDLREANRLRCAGDHKEVIEIYSQIIESEKEDLRILRKACMQRAFHDGRLEQYDKAIADFTRSLDLRMKRGTLEDRGDGHTARGDTKRAASGDGAAMEQAVLNDSRKRLQDKIDALR